MTYTTHSLVQGTPEWAAHRSNSDNASELAVVLGISPQMQRNEYIRLRATGSEKEFSDWVIENILADGHLFEHLARPIAEEIIGDEIYPMTVSIAADGLKNLLSASLDGSTADDLANWEHKRLNAALRASLALGNIPDEYHPQMEQGMMINGATRCLFMASEWAPAPAGEVDEDGRTYGFVTEESGDEVRYVLIDEMHAWYESNPALRAKIIPAWQQVEADIAAYEHVEVIPAAVATPVKDLPAVTYKLNGTALTSNLAEYKVRALELVEDSKKPMESDQDFADRIELCKKFGEAEKKIELMQAQVVGEIHDVNAFCTDLGEISKMFRAARIAGEKLVEAEKANRKNKILTGAKEKWQEHIAGLNKRLGKPYMPDIPADFALAIKGLKSMSSMQNACDTLLANAKLAANAACDKIDANLKTLRELAADHAFLFADTPQLIGKDNDDLTAIIKSRINDHVEAKRKEEEATRERIAKEEREKAEREAASKLEAERRQAAAEERAKIDQEQKAERDRQAKAAAEIEADSQRQAAESRARIAEAQSAFNAQQTAQATVAQNGASSPPEFPAVLSPAEAVAEPAPSAAPAVTGAESVTQIDNGARINLGMINAVLGFTVTAGYLADIGIEPAGTDKRAVLYRESDFPMICRAIANHVVDKVDAFLKVA